MLGIAFAMAGQAQQGGGNPIVAFLPLILIFIIFYFLLIRPQQKRAKEHQKFLEGLKRGDRVFTSGGIIGHVVRVDNNVVTLEIANDIHIKVIKSYIAGPVSVLSEEKK